MSDLATVRTDLLAQQHDLDVLVADLEPSRWSAPTPSPGWSVADQIGHLMFFDDAAALAIEQPDEFVVTRTAAVDAMRSAGGADDYTLGVARSLAPADLLTAWRAARARLTAAADRLEPGTRVPWYGPTMGATSFLTARLMEVWAHGIDIADTVGHSLVATDRLRHVAQLGFITRNWSYTVRGAEPPTTTVRLELRAPSGATLTWGPDDADECVRGSLESFCLVVTQRRNVLDTDLDAEGTAREWMAIAQAFAGAPTEPPAPRRAAP